MNGSVDCSLALCKVPQWNGDFQGSQGSLLSFLPKTCTQVAEAPGKCPRQTSLRSTTFYWPPPTHVPWCWASRRGALWCRGPASPVLLARPQPRTGSHKLPRLALTPRCSAGRCCLHPPLSPSPLVLLSRLQNCQVQSPQKNHDIQIGCLSVLLHFSHVLL